jgi:DNA polymerase-3 subunit gamma/tau
MTPSAAFRRDFEIKGLDFSAVQPFSPSAFSHAVSSTYQVIARKWRPQTFDDLVGQDHVVRTLKNAITRGRIAHAYLFVGPRGTGKTSTARIFAKALNCTGGPKADFDPNDPACKAIAEGSHLDVIEIDGASNNGVDQVRDLRETVRYAPAQGKFKVYIIDEVHMLSAAAFNALLKTLEEPPAHVKFVFATTDPQKVLPTIVSRCQRFDLKPIPQALIVERLKKISDEEKIKVSDAALASIARLADGGMRDAQSILDQMISFCGNEISEPDVLDVYGLVSAEKINALACALATADHKKIVSIVDESDSEGRDLVRLLVDLEALVRGAVLDAIAKGGKTDQLGCVMMTTEQLTRMLDALREGEGNVKLGLAEKINFEVTLLKAVEASRARAIDSLINYETVKYFGNEGFEASRYDESMQRFEAAAVKIKSSLSLLNVGQSTIIAIGVTLIMWQATQVLVGQLADTTDFEPSVVSAWHSTHVTEPPFVLVVA